MIDYMHQPDKFRIVVLGNSFTFGSGTPDGQDWPSALARTAPQFQVINLGVGGYGIDQMYITLRETIEDYRPHMVVLGFIDDDLVRALLSFNGYKKPRFVLVGTALINSQPRIGDLKSTYAELSRKQEVRDAEFRGPLFPFALKHLYHKLVREHLFGEDDYSRLNARLLDETAKVCEAYHASFLVVHLVSGHAIRNPNAPSSGEGFLKHYVSTREIDYLVTREHFLQQGHHWVTGHYGAQEHAVAATAIRHKIMQLPVWQDWKRRNER